MEVGLEGWKRARHAKRCTILRICSGANPFDGHEPSGIMNDDTQQIRMSRFRAKRMGREELHYHEREGGIVCLFWRAEPSRRGEFQANCQT